MSSLAKSTLQEILIGRMVRTETHYKTIELESPCDPMSDEMLARMNFSLGFSGERSKDREYRPYCISTGCTHMPRMHRVKEGFACWSCGNIWRI